MNNKKIIMLDLCSISTIKTGISGNFKGDKTKKNNFKHLNKMILSKKVTFSFLFAIIERCSYPTEIISKDELIKQFQNDYKILLEIIDKKNIYESEYIIAKMVNTLLDKNYQIHERLEQGFHLGVMLIEYLESIVEKGGIKCSQRENLIDQLFEKAKKLNLCTNNLIFITCVSAVYGCQESLSILKLYDENFNATNAASDIYAIYRVASVIDSSKQYGIDTEIVFHTTDKNLERYMNYFHVTAKHQSSRIVESTITYKEKEKIFPAIFNKKQNKDTNEEKFNKLANRMDGLVT